MGGQAAEIVGEDAFDELMKMNIEMKKEYKWLFLTFIN